MANPTKSILPPEMTGACKVTGYRGRGKSYFASQMENPTLTAFFDFERKGEGIDSQLRFGLYCPVTELASGGTGIYDTFMRAVEAIEPNQFAHVILDNTAPLEMALGAEAVRNADLYAKSFGMDAGNIRANKYGGKSGTVNYLIAEKICNPLWAKGVKLITAVSHIKPRWSGGVQVPNSYNIKGADRWEELSILTLIIIPGDHPPAPSALVMKEQLGAIGWDEKKGTFRVSRRLPYRLPLATPAEVYRYLKNPVDLDNLKPGEMPSEDEIGPFREKLSREQMSIILAEIESNRQTISEEITVDLAALAKIVLGEKPDASLPEFAKLLSERSGVTVSVPRAKQLMSQNGEK